MADHMDNVAPGSCPQTDCGMCSLQSVVWDETSYISISTMQQKLIIWKNVPILFCLELLAYCSNGNCTTGSQHNSLLGQTHASVSCLTLTLWIPGQTLVTATSTACFVQNPSILRCT